MHITAFQYCKQIINSGFVYQLHIHLVVKYYIFTFYKRLLLSGDQTYYYPLYAIHLTKC